MLDELPDLEQTADKGGRHDLEVVKRDLESFFTDNDHQVYEYGSKATDCHKDSVFYKKQIQVLFEEKYPHEVTGRAVKELTEDGFLKLDRRTMKNESPIDFISRANVRYFSRQIKDKLKIVDAFSEYEVNNGVGKHAEDLFRHMFEENQFEIAGRHINEFRGKKWCTKKNLDYIVQKDEITYGVEIKNTFDYMPNHEFNEKLAMCEYLGLLPLFPIRCPSPQHYKLMREAGGLALKFKTRVFPQGNQDLEAAIWNHFRLPVFIWGEITPNIERNFLRYHQTHLPK